jgi:hypothetical protein
LLHEWAAPTPLNTWGDYYYYVRRCFSSFTPSLSIHTIILRYWQCPPLRAENDVETDVWQTPHVHIAYISSLKFMVDFFPSPDWSASRAYVTRVTLSARRAWHMANRQSINSPIERSCFGDSCHHERAARGLRPRKNKPERANVPLFGKTCRRTRQYTEDEDSRRRCNVGQILVLNNPPAVVIENDRSTDIGA